MKSESAVQESPVHKAVLKTLDMAVFMSVYRATSLFNMRVIKIYIYIYIYI